MSNAPNAANGTKALTPAQVAWGVANAGNDARTATIDAFESAVSAAASTRNPKTKARHVAAAKAFQARAVAEHRAAALEVGKLGTPAAKDVAAYLESLASVYETADPTGEAVNA